MRALGISIYPEKSSKTEILNYIDKAANAGFTRIFSCLLSVNKPREEIKADFLEINQYAKKRGFEIIVDVSPKVFQELQISYQELSFFKEIEADGLRLDMGFTGNEEALMTYNPYQLKIEINMSNDTHMIDTIMDYKPNRYNLYGCHNFYPHAYSGLSLKHFLKCSQNFNRYGLHTAAFVCAQGRKTFGPWPVTQGLPTLEMHRNMPLATQIQHLIVLDIVDDIIISNCYPSEEELDEISKLRLDMVTFTMDVQASTPEVERKILFEELHFHRGDASETMLRSTQSRVKYKGHHFALFHAPKQIRRGDVVIESSAYGHYAGEVQIALCDMENCGMSNVVGHIMDGEHFLLDCIQPWQKFQFRSN